MENAVYAVTTLTIVLLGAALLVAWSRKDIPLIRGFSGAMAIIAAAVSAVAVSSILGWAVPLVSGITAPAGEFQVLSAKLAPQQGIYITVDLPGEPKLFWLPWDLEMAESIQEMMANGGAMVEVPPFEWSWDVNPPTLDELPQPKLLPDKPEDAGPQAPHFDA